MIRRRPCRKIDVRFGRLEAKMDVGFARLERKIDQIVDRHVRKLSSDGPAPE